MPQPQGNLSNIARSVQGVHRAGVSQGVQRNAFLPCEGSFALAVLTSERSMKSIAERTLAAVFQASKVRHAHAHRFRHTLATELLGRGASFEDVADILGNSPEIVRKHYAKWSPARQACIDDLMEKVHSGTDFCDPRQSGTGSIVPSLKRTFAGFAGRGPVRIGVRGDLHYH